MITLLIVYFFTATSPANIGKASHILIRASIASAAIHKGIDPDEALAVAWKESKFRPEAISHTNDYGLFQVHCGKGWSWCRKWGLPKQAMLNPAVNIAAGMNIIIEAKRMEKKTGKPWQWWYNHDDKYVVSVKKLTRAFRRMSWGDKLTKQLW